MIDISLLKKSLDSVEVTGDMITKMMEQSVNPNIGANVDVRI
ncbi:MAG: YjfB family protein [Lachnospiraceae bacterium]|nr:YjfB family protein [Lachnospiraceae bacterium]